MKLTMKDCIFCKMINGEINIKKIYEDEKTLAFLDLAPASPKGGHILVIPKKHYQLIYEMSQEDSNAIMETIKKVSKAILNWSEGLNILQNNGHVSGQAVFHAHFHLIPRFENDGIEIEKWKPRDYKDGEMTKIQQQIKTLLKES